ncbi:MAG: FAD-binding oxidoreductase [Gammaproteobacteria bacterium]|nr:FAD-binding oxidoreductase [Gammaproteobacteria bacterium]
MTDSVLGELRSRLGEGAVLTGADAAARHHTDWSGSPHTAPAVVLRPRDPAGVAAALGICHSAGQGLCVQGGLTGLAGGANPLAGEWVLSLERLTAIEEIDAVGGTAIVQAGVPLQRLQEQVAAQGWFFPVDLGARGSCQVGGNAATNAGGIRVLRYGMMRESVLGLEVALADGRLLTMLNRVLKNNAGFDLKHLFIGSEGTLGVITRLSVRLVPLAGVTRTALCALPAFEAAPLLLREARRQLPDLGAFELMWQGYFDTAVRTIGRPSPFHEPHPLYALVETLGTDEARATAAMDDFLEAGLSAKLLSDAVVAQSLEQAGGLWAFREAIAELVADLAPAANFDVSVPLPRMGAFIERIEALLRKRYPAQRHLLFGHLGDGNLHLTSGPYREPGDFLAVEELVYGAVGAAGGSLSAEHGIGTVKREFLHHSRSAEELALMRTLKQALDPLGILNRGRVLS